MKKLSILIVFCSIFLFSCSYSRFTLTGAPYEPLPEEMDVRIVSEGNLEKYEEIGVAEIKNSDSGYRIAEAKRLSKLHGGEIIMPIEDETDLINADKDPETQSFRVLLELEMEAEEEISTKEPEEEPEPIVDPELDPELEDELDDENPTLVKKPDYSHLPIVPYNILAGECNNLKGEKFRAVMYPKKAINAPNSLKSYVRKNKRLIEMREKKGGNKLYLIIHKDEVKKFNKMAKKREKLYFVYTPVALYKFMCPVAELIDIIE